jgi:hypothetical protein
MKKFFVLFCGIVFTAFIFNGCGSGPKNNKLTKEDSIMQSKVKEYATVKLTSDLSKLTEKEKQLVVALIDIAKIMDELYWQQTLGDKQLFLDSIKNDNEKKIRDNQLRSLGQVG